MPKKNAGFWFAEIYPQIVRRVGTEPENRLRWLLNFINTEAGESDPRIVGAEAEFFMQTPPTEKGPALSEAELKELARELKKQLSNFIVAQVSFVVSTRGAVRHYVYRNPFVVMAPQKNRRGDFVLSAPTGPEIRYDCQYQDDAFKMRAFELISSHADTLASCKECDQFFARSRTDQEYCSTKCSQAVRTRRFLENKTKNREARNEQADDQAPGSKRG